MKMISFVLMLYFTMLSLAPNWQGVQLLNATALIEHYQDHQSESKDASIFSFIQEHYFNKIHHFDKEHEKLPLKTTVQVSAIYLAESFEHPIPVVHTNEEFYNVRKHHNRRVMSFLSNDFHSIWHPPQLG